jgi:outer membrane protein
VIQSQLTNELNKVSLAQTRANRIPGLSANASESLNAGKTIDPTENTYVDQAFHSTNFSVNSSLNLFNGLQNTNTIRQNKINVKAGEYDIEKVKNDLTINVTTAFLQVLFSYEILSTSESQVESTEAQTDRTRKMVDAGKLAESNLFQIQSQLATDRLAVVNALNQLDMAKVTLIQLMEIPVSSDFDIEKPVLPDPSYRLQENNEQLFQKALITQPQIASSSLKSNAALLGMKISNGTRYPRLNLGVGISTNYASSRTKGGVNPEHYPFSEQIWNNLGENVSLSLYIPIFSNRQLQSNIDRARINLMNVRLNEQNTRNQLRKTIEQTATDLKAAAKKYEATQDQLKAVELSYRNIETKYNVGMVNAIDFLIEKNNYTKALSNLIQAKYDYIFKLKILDFYLGKEIRFE